MDARLDSDSSGFTLSPPKGESIHVRWDEVREIRTYKIDLLSYDEICLCFEVAGTGTTEGGTLWIEVTESDQGFRLLTDHMERRFPAIPSDWYSEVMFPAFATCEAVLYRAE